MAEANRREEKEGCVKKNPTAALAVAGGIGAVAAGAVSCICCDSREICMVSAILTLTVNILVHIRSYIGNKRLGKEQTNVLTISIAESIFLVMMAACAVQIMTADTVLMWQRFATVYVCYLVMNGVSLLGIPLGLARISGFMAILSAVSVYLWGMKWGLQAALWIGVSLMTNGTERVAMTLMQIRRTRIESRE